MIAGELNSLGYRLPSGRLFSGAFIRNILEYGHIYTGRVAFYKASKGKFYSGNKNSPVPVKNLKGKTKRSIILMIGLSVTKCLSRLLAWRNTAKLTIYWSVRPDPGYVKTLKQSMLGY